jgi:hypothetical protein
LVWFAIFVWAVISSAGIFTDFTGIPLCYFGTFVLIILCLVSYRGGFRTIQGSSFEEDLHHLEYYIDTYVKEIDNALPDLNGQVIFQITKRGRRWVLIDIIVEFTFSSETIIEFHLGLSSLEQERIIIVTPSSSLDAAYRKFQELPFIEEDEWTLEQMTTQSGRIIRILNSQAKLCLCDRSTFVVNPELVRNNILTSKNVFFEICSLLKSSLITE